MTAPRADAARAAASRTTRLDTRLASQSNLAFFHAASAASAFAFASSNVRFSIMGAGGGGSKPKSSSIETGRVVVRDVDVEVEGQVHLVQVVARDLPCPKL